MIEVELKACKALLEILLKKQLSEKYAAPVVKVEICELHDEDWNIHVIMEDKTRHNLWGSELDKLLNG